MLNATVLAERLGRTPAERPRAVSKTLQYVWLHTIYGQVPQAAGPAGARRAIPTCSPIAV